MPEGKKLLPVRVVQPSRDFLHKDERKRGSGSKFFIKDERQFRLHQESLVSELSSIETDLEKTFVKYPSVPSVLKAKLIEDAWAKSHRPNDIFDIYTCPISLFCLSSTFISFKNSLINKRRCSAFGNSILIL